MLQPFIPLLKRKFHKRPLVAITNAPPAALVLVAATYKPTAPRNVTLTFDRAIDVSAIVVSEFTVFAGLTSRQFGGSGAATLSSPNIVIVPLVQLEIIASVGTKLYVGATNGIVAVDDGGMWEGVEGLALPFG